MRVGLYARFSTDMQSAASIADQLVGCRRLAEQLGAEVVGEFEDAAISGQSMANRPGLKALLALAEAGGLDVVIAEHTDRLSRSLTDTSAIYDDLRALGVRIVTVNQGEVGTMQVGMSGTMSALFIEEIAKKTRRGLAGVVRSGRAAGPLQFGYEVVVAYDARGERIRGLRQLKPAEAPVVLRIFTEYASGVSPLAIAAQLNLEGVPGPKGRQWNSSTINGAASRGVGILRCEIYRGVRVWGRNGSAKDRRTGKRRALAGRPAGEVQREDVPELRIVPEDLWKRAQARLAELAMGPRKPRAHRRPTTLLGGLIRCGECGSGMTTAGSDRRLRCARRAQRGPAGCSNVRKPNYADIEARVLESIQANLLHPDVVATFVTEFQQALAAARRAAVQGQAAARAELAEVKQLAARQVQLAEEGMPWSAVAERHAQLTARQDVLERQLKTAAGGATVIELHPAAAGMYRRMVEDLHLALAEPAVGMPRPTVARDAIRALVSAVRFIPLEAKGAYELEIAAELAPVLGVEHCGQVRLAG